MSWRRKKPKPLDFSGFDDSLVDVPLIDAGTSPPGGPLIKIPFELAQKEAVPDLERTWSQLGARAWGILAGRRMRSIWPADEPTEFKRYVDLLRRSRAKNQAFSHEVFVGLEHPGPRPIFVPRFVFQRHSYVLGGSGSGKTSHALAQLMIQLAEPYPWIKRDRADRTAILIFDMKPNGDRFLRALAEQVARDEGRQFRFFSSDPHLESHIFDPFFCLRTIDYPLARVEILLKVFSLIYTEGYGSDFFTNEQRIQLSNIIHEHRPRTFDELIRAVAAKTTGASGNKDARGLYSALGALQNAIHVNTGETPVDRGRLIDFDRFLENGEIIYVHLDSRSNYLLSRDIGKMMVFSLMEAASQREKRGVMRQAFVILDEFQRLAARNIIETFEDARSSGIGFVLAHQSSSSLQTRDGDLYGILFENTSFKQCLTLEDPKVIELLRLIAGRKAEQRTGGSTSTSTGKSTTDGWGEASSISNMRSTTTEPGILFGGTTSNTAGSSDGVTNSRSRGTSQSEGESETKSWKEEMVPGLTPEMIQQVNDTELLSVIHVKGVGPKGLTPTGGGLTLIQGLFPVSADEYGAMAEQTWPDKPDLDPEDFYRKAGPTIPAGVVETLAAEGRRSKARSRGANAGERKEFEKPRNEGEQRALQSRLRSLAARLASQMLREPISIEAFSRSRSLRVDVVLDECRAMGLAVDSKESHLSGRQADALERRLRGKSAT